jgi:hypothetical protein
MEPEYLPTEVILTKSQQTLGKIRLNWRPQPGNYLDLDGKTYAVLERRHRYQLKAGSYKLHDVALFVQTAIRPLEQTEIDGVLVVGDASCTYNARSELLRCAILPEGPCEGCHYYQSRSI